MASWAHEEQAHGTGMLTLLRAWWNAPANYTWLLGFLEARGVVTALRVLIGAGGLVLAVIVVLVQFAQGGPETVAGRVIDALIALLALGWAVMWVVGSWPTTARSFTLVAAADAAITAACLQDADRLAALTGTMLFVVTGAYVTFFHGPKTLACHIAWAALTVAGMTAWMGFEQGLPGLAMGSAKALIVLAAVAGILPAVQFGYWLVHTSAVDSLVDPLTGLANRRGFEYHRHTFAAHRSGRTLCAIAIDLDAFKAINDEHGHHVGDEVLVRTAERIAETVGTGALVARLGGEEFVVIDDVAVDVAAMICERLRSAIASGPPPAVTASIGLAVIEQDHPFDGQAIIELVAQADQAMYRAKRRGGDGVEIDQRVNGCS